MKKKFAVIGFPVEHSLSPLMHEAGFQTMGIEAEYHKVPIRPSELKQGISELQKNYDGWNVTYPLKEEIVSCLDKISPQALAIGAVNTVQVAEGLLWGHNTDGAGFVLSLQEQGFSFQGKNIVLLGAGGAAKAIAVSLAGFEVNLLILNRTPEKAKKLSAQLVRLGEQADWGLFGPGEWLRNVDLLIQTTPIGMKGEDYSFSLKGINPASYAVDLIYRPPLTPFLSQAAACGCQTMNGLEMLVYQGALAWQIWLGIEAPIGVMRDRLLRAQVTGR